MVFPFAAARRPTICPRSSRRGVAPFLFSPGLDLNNEGEPREISISEKPFPNELRGAATLTSLPPP